MSKEKNNTKTKVMMYICQKDKKLTKEEEILMLEKMIEQQIILSGDGDVGYYYHENDPEGRY